MGLSTIHTKLLLGELPECLQRVAADLVITLMVGTYGQIGIAVLNSRYKKNVILGFKKSFSSFRVKKLFI